MTSKPPRWHLLWHNDTEIPSWHNVFARFIGRHSGARQKGRAGRPVAVGWCCHIQKSRFTITE
jgi:hypothetical protein